MKSSITLLSTLLLITISCDKEETGPATPTPNKPFYVATLPLSGSSVISEITTHSATVTSTTINDGQIPVTSRGIIYGRITPDTIIDSTIFNGFGVGTFTTYLSNLQSAQKYFVKVFSVNAVGTHTAPAAIFETKN